MLFFIVKGSKYKCTIILLYIIIHMLVVADVGYRSGCESAPCGSADRLSAEVMAVRVHTCSNLGYRRNAN